MGSVSATTDIIQLGTFILDDQLFGVDILRMREILRPQEIIKVPCTVPGAAGVINLRGQVIPIVNLRQILGASVKEAGPDSRIIIVDIEGMNVGILVDAIGQIRRLSSDAIEDAPPVLMGMDTSSLSGIIRDKDALILALCLERLVDIKALQEMI